MVHKRIPFVHELVFRNARTLFLAWLLFVFPSVTFKSQRTWSSSWKFSYCKHLMMVFSASWSSGSVTLSIDFSTSVLDLVTGLSGLSISLLWSLDLWRKHRAMTFIARYQLDTPYNLLISKWSRNGATIDLPGQNGHFLHLRVRVLKARQLHVFWFTGSASPQEFWTS